jgi:hypothetical protein
MCLRGQAASNLSLNILPVGTKVGLTDFLMNTLASASCEVARDASLLDIIADVSSSVLLGKVKVLEDVEFSFGTQDLQLK